MPNIFFFYIKYQHAGHQLAIASFDQCKFYVLLLISIESSMILYRNIIFSGHIWVCPRGVDVSDSEVFGEGETADRVL